MNLTIQRLKTEFAKVIEDGADSEEIREFFRSTGDPTELVVKCVMWGHYFWPKYFSKSTPKFHYELIKKFFSPGNDYTACPRGFGKALALDTPILTNKGFKKLVDVKVGEFIFSEKGKQVEVLYKSKIYKNRDCYEVIFSDGSKIVADAEHDWLVEDNLLRHRVELDYISRNRNKEAIIPRKSMNMKLIKKTTKELSEDLFVKRNDGKVEIKYSIPVAKSVEYIKNIFSINPKIKRRFIVDIKKIKSVPVQCLMVDNPTHLFLAGIALIPTHNTTIMQLCISYSCTNGLDEFICLIEKTYTEASEVLEAVREEFKLNDEVLRVYGDLTKVNPKGRDQDNIRDSAGDFFVNGVRLRAKGYDTPIRGLKSRHSRPTRVLLDDVESDEHIENVEQRQKYLNNYIKGIIPAVDNETGVIKMFGTILHDDSLLHTLVINHNGRIYRAWEGKDRKLLWPSNWTVEKLEQKREEMRISEKGDAGFYQEYFNEPISEEDQIFRKEMFRYFNQLQWDDDIKKKAHKIYTLVDPAISKKETADFTAIITVAVDSMNKIYVLQISRGRLDPIETIKTIFAHYETWKPMFVGIETTAYQKALKFFIEEEKKRQDSSVQSMQIVEIKPTIDKITKIKKLQPKYAIANVYHNSDDQNTPVLEQELLRFPKAAHDDCCLTSHTQVATLNGYKKIINIKPGEKVWTRQGLKKVLMSKKTGTKKVISRYGITGTPNHPVWTQNRGWTELQSLKDLDVLVFLEKQSSGTGKDIIDTQHLKEDSSGSILTVILEIKYRLKYYIGMFGNILMARSLLAGTYITKMAQQIIGFLHLKWSLRSNTAKEGGFQKNCLQGKKDTQENQIGLTKKSYWKEEEKEAKQLKKSKKKKEENILKKIIMNSLAKIVGLSLKIFHGEYIMFVSSAWRKEGTKKGTQKNFPSQKETAPIAENTLKNSVKMLYIVAKDVNTKGCLNANGSVVDVYNLEVEDCHEYFANNILVHNCDCLSNVIEIMIPVGKTIDRTYKKYAKTRVSGISVKY